MTSQEPTSGFETPDTRQRVGGEEEAKIGGEEPTDTTLTDAEEEFLRSLSKEPRIGGTSGEPQGGT